jgi:hypothetical protein
MATTDKPVIEQVAGDQQRSATSGVPSVANVSQITTEDISVLLT